VRGTIQENHKYRALFPDVRIRRDSNANDDWKLEQGYRSTFRAVGTGSGIPGFGFDVGILDDVSDPNEQQSETKTSADWAWFKNVFSPRAEPHSAIVVVNNRTGVNDIAGHLLDRDRNDSRFPTSSWDYIEIPAYDSDRGEYIWVDRFGLDFYLSLQLDQTLWQIQYQQQPVKSEGNLIKREKAQYIPKLPEGVREQVRANDLALTIKQTGKNDPDYTAELGGAKHNDFLYLVNPRLYRAEIPEITTRLMTYKIGHPYIRMGMGKALHEKAVAQNLIAAGFPIEPYKEKGDVIERMAAFINLWDTGRVILVGTEAEWLPFMNQWCALPQGHDDAGAVAAGVTIMLGYLPTQSEKRKREPSPYAFIDSM
jgi:phage terminase large subunit-like protein